MSLVLEFVSCEVKNLVNVPEDVMDGWVQNPKALQKALTDALCPSRWRRENGVIYFDVIFDGTSGPDWIVRLEKAGKRIGDYARSVLLSPDFKPSAVGPAKIAVLMGESFSDEDRITAKIRTEADKQKFTKPNADLACVIREMFSDREIEDMGLWRIVAMHEPIKVSDGSPDLLGANRRDDGGWLDAYYGKPDDCWSRDNGFAFVSQVSS